MEEQHYPQDRGPSAQTKDCKFTDFMEMREGKAQEDVGMIDLETEDKHEAIELKEKHTLLEELHSTQDDSSSPSDKEVGGETKKRKNKGLKVKIKDKISLEEEEQCTDQKDTYITMEECDNKVENGEATNSEEKKGFLEKIKQTLPASTRRLKKELQLLLIKRMILEEVI